MKTTLTAAAMVAALGVAPALARPAMVETDLNVRAGQGTSHPVISVLPEGTVVDVRGCGDGWCYVPELGGYASASYLQPVRGGAMRPQRRAPYAGPMAYDPVWRDGYYDDPYVHGGGIGFSFGTPGVHIGGWRY
ncbi:SH3 domain-containing protein [Phreatobacter cathodiphilus]|uniref:SH3b domain-containing protein n=1 Tax=Phreatobacter cathodiphilus TaxID=1868589 RepID=A0A2S0N7Z0_9HYPH|nr:SH3 domain-containing protein [Phreatobacter cathodiphilus]AVO44279.1 hypothetical protein C6569_03905 [Phreatobacter cathodiphilus]